MRHFTDKKNNLSALWWRNYERKHYFCLFFLHCSLYMLIEIICDKLKSADHAKSLHIVQWVQLRLQSNRLLDYYLVPED